MIAKARKAVLADAAWLTAAQVAEAAACSVGDLHEQLDSWTRLKQMFVIDLDGVAYVPAYGLDPDAGYRPRQAVMEILQIFGERKDSWGLAYWFLAVNSFLGGRRPQDMLPINAACVVAAARDEAADAAAHA